MHSHNGVVHWIPLSGSPNKSLLVQHTTEFGRARVVVRFKGNYRAIFSPSGRTAAVRCQVLTAVVELQSSSWRAKVDG